MDAKEYTEGYEDGESYARYHGRNKAMSTAVDALDQYTREGDEERCTYWAGWLYAAVKTTVEQYA